MEYRGKYTLLLMVLFPLPWPLCRSPISSLPTLFDQTVSASGGPLENVPQATPNIEQLLEKQGNGEAGVNSESYSRVLLHIGEKSV